MFLQQFDHKFYLFLFLIITGAKVNIKKLFEMTTKQKCCVIGTLFKSMELKPNILKEISKDVSNLYSKFTEERSLVVKELQRGVFSLSLATPR